jgi:branched-subunit amino acid aminotransferase/4-amino-4-deoxychorismate lyase
MARLEPLPVSPDPYRLVVMPHPLNEGRSDPQAPHKGLSGPWSAAIRTEAQRLGGEDALLLWPDDTLAETAIAAVGLEVNGTLLLPPPEGRVASLAERLDLPAWAAGRGLRIEAAPIPRSRTQEGRLWCLNALRGIWPASLM